MPGIPGERGEQVSVWVPGPAWMSSSQGQLPTSFLLSPGQSWHPRAPWGEGGARHDGKEPEGSQHRLVALRSLG